MIAISRASRSRTSFVDTAPFGSHTTVNDALFAGLPVVTMPGASFAGRVVSELSDSGRLAASSIASDLDAVHGAREALAVDRRATRVAATGCAKNAARSPLFDMDTYARTFEAAIETAWRERSRP